MSAPLMFARDGRTLPFVPVTQAALVAIAVAAPSRRLAYARSLYLALLEICNEGRSDRAPITRKELAKRSGCSADLVSDLRAVLEAAQVVRVVERSHGGQRLEHEWVIVEPGDDEAGSPDPLGAQPPPPSAASHGGTGAQPRVLPTREEQEDGENPPNPPTNGDQFPDELPSELVEVAIEAGKILKRTAIARGQGRAVTRAAVGHAVLTFPDRDHVKRARDVEYWLLHGRGARKSCSDIVARYRNFLEDSEPRAGTPLAPTASAQASASSATIREMAAELRSRGQ